MSTTPTPPNGMVSNTELILRKILGEDVTPLPPNSRVEFYLTQVEEYIERLATGATRPIGETTTPLTDGATTNPITIDGESYTAQINDLVFYQNKEFLFTVNGWREVGDLTNLNADMIDDTNTTNKFATQAQLDQIGTNQNNILLNKYSSGLQNLLNFIAWSNDVQVVRGTKTITTNAITLTATSNNCSTAWGGSSVASSGKLPVTAGQSLVMIWDTETDSGSNMVSIYGNGDSTMQATATAQTKYLEFTVPNNCTYITFGFNVATNGDTVTYSNVRIYDKALYTIYQNQPYAMSNADLTTKEKQNESNISSCYSLKGITEISDNIDLNDLTTIGNFYKSSNIASVSNKPTGVDTSSPFRLDVIHVIPSGYRYQSYLEWKSGKKYYRIRDTEWGSWKLVEDDWQRIADLESFMAEKYPVAITTQPTAQSGAVGETVVFTVAASGVGLRYQWNYKAPSSSQYLPIGFGDNTKTSLSVPITAARDGMTYACKVYDAANNIVMSDGAVLTVIE